MSRRSRPAAGDRARPASQKRDRIAKRTAYSVVILGACRFSHQNLRRARSARAASGERALRVRLLDAAPRSGRHRAWSGPHEAAASGRERSRARPPLRGEGRLAGGWSEPRPRPTGLPGAGHSCRDGGIRAPCTDPARRRGPDRPSPRGAHAPRRAGSGGRAEGHRRRPLRGRGGGCPGGGWKSQGALGGGATSAELDAASAVSTVLKGVGLRVCKPTMLIRAVPLLGALVAGVTAVKAVRRETGRPSPCSSPGGDEERECPASGRYSAVAIQRRETRGARSDGGRHPSRRRARRRHAPPARGDLRVLRRGARQSTPRARVRRPARRSLGAEWSPHPVRQKATAIKGRANRAALGPASRASRGSSPPRSPGYGSSTRSGSTRGEE